MQDSKSTTQTFDMDDRDDIDLIDLLASLFKARLTIGLTSLMFALAGLVATVFMPYKYQGTLPIHPLSQIETIGFTDWNNRLTKIASNSLYYPKSTGIGNGASTISFRTGEFGLGTLPQITNQTLFEEFKTRFVRLSDVRSAIQANTDAIFGEVKDSKSLNDKEIELAKSFVLKETGVQTNEIVFSISDPQLGKKIIDDALNNLFTSIKQNNIELITKKLDLARQSLKESLTSLNIELSALEVEYDLNKQRALTILREQADIARQLGYAKPIDTEDLSFEKIYDGYPQALKPFYNTLYTQGYLVLEEQIRKIESREEIWQTPLSTSVDPILFRKYVLETDNSIESLKAVAARLPYHDPAFSTVKYDLSELTFKKKGNDLLTIIVSAFLGFIVGCIAALIKNAFAKRRDGIASV